MVTTSLPTLLTPLTAQRLAHPTDAHPFDHLLVADPELLAGPEEGRHDGVLGVGVDAGPSVTEVVRVEEERGAR